MTITVANIRHTKKGVYIGRAMPRQGLKASPLGNPYKLLKDCPRWVPIAQFQEWLEWQMENDSPARREIERLTEMARQGDLVLLCWCAPLSCHGDVVKAEIERRLAVQP